MFTPAVDRYQAAFATVVSLACRYRRTDNRPQPDRTTGYTGMERELPTVTVIMPVREEADAVENAIRSVLASDYPRDRVEVLVVDGMSRDATRAIVQRISEEDPRVRLLDNPKRTVPYAMNIGIRHAQGEVIIRVDGHADVDRDFIRETVTVLQDRPEVWCAGGPTESVNTTFTGRVIAAAMSSPVGVGSARFRLGNYEGFVDTVAFGGYRRWVFDRIGLFDEDLVRNQDDELNLRVVLGGGKIYLTPRIRSRYYPRSSLRKLARQYYQYGFWRIRTIQKHRRPATLRQVAPLCFVLTWLALTAASFIWVPARILLAGFAALYGIGLIIRAVDVARRGLGLKGALLAPVVFCILHFCYGLGSLHGLIWFVLLKRPPGKPEEHALSR